MASVLLSEMDLFQPCYHALTGQQPVHQQRDDNTNAGIHDAVQGIGYIGLNSSMHSTTPPGCTAPGQWNI